MIWVYTVCSGLLVRLFIVNNVLDLKWDDSVIIAEKERILI